MHGKLLSFNSKMLTRPWTAKSYNPLDVESNTMYIAMNSCSDKAARRADLHCEQWLPARGYGNQTKRGSGSRRLPNAVPQTGQACKVALVCKSKKEYAAK